MDIERAKQDVVYFAENVLEFSLQDWQKDLLRKYEQGEIIWFGGVRYYGRNIVKEVIREHQKITFQKE